jgi:hypothetical protein
MIFKETHNDPHKSNGAKNVVPAVWLLAGVLVGAGIPGLAQSGRGTLTGYGEGRKWSRPTRSRTRSEGDKYRQRLFECIGPGRPVYLSRTSTRELHP